MGGPCLFPSIKCCIDLNLITEHVGSVVKQCHKPPMAGKGNHTTYKNGHMGRWFYYRFTHIASMSGNLGPAFVRENVVKAS